VIDNDRIPTDLLILHPTRRYLVQSLSSVLLGLDTDA
jgi:hypothetical protein